MDDGVELEFLSKRVLRLEARLVESEQGRSKAEQDLLLERHRRNNVVEENERLQRQVADLKKRNRQLSKSLSNSIPKRQPSPARLAEVIVIDDEPDLVNEFDLPWQSTPDHDFQLVAGPSTCGSPKKAPASIDPKLPTTAKRRTRSDSVASTPVQNRKKIKLTDESETSKGVTSASNADVTSVPNVSSKTKGKKLKSNACPLEPTLVEKYIDSAEVFKIDPPPPNELYIPRKFIEKTYGGNGCHFVQYGLPELNPTPGKGKRCMVFGKTKMNPYTPQKPGSPGLMFASRLELLDTEHGPWSVFGNRLLPKGVSRWEYLGGYTCELADEKVDFNAQDKATQEEWVTHVFESQKPAYVKMRRNIALRKHKCDPNDSDAEKRFAEDEEAFPVDEEDIRRALKSGKEGIGLIVMTCVEYDHVFLNDIQKKLKTWKPPRKKSKQQPEPKSKGSKGNARSKERKGKAQSRRKSLSLSPSASSVLEDVPSRSLRKRYTTTKSIVDDSDEDEDVDYDDDDDNEEFEG
ncbi:hypothetical protein C8J56DRAFT_1174121 [Mycena floridula]|nr:hypothetical protein C8J56DRAFT_1174121 [Mycena floridula]